MKTKLPHHCHRLAAGGHFWILAVRLPGADDGRLPVVTTFGQGPARGPLSEPGVCIGKWPAAGAGAFY